METGAGYGLHQGIHALHVVTSWMLQASDTCSGGDVACILIAVEYTLTLTASMQRHLPYPFEVHLTASTA